MKGKLITAILLFGLIYALSFINFFIVGQLFPGGNSLVGLIGAAFCMLCAIIVVCTYAIITHFEKK